MTTDDKPKTRPYPAFGYPTPPKVDRDPTQAMIDAGVDSVEDHVGSDVIATIWRAMYDAGMKKE